MEKIEGFDNVVINNNFEKLEVGGHVCKIIGIDEEKFAAKDGRVFERLNIKIDIAEPDKQAGFYSRKYESDVASQNTNAKWKGFYRLNVPDTKTRNTKEEEEKRLNSIRTFKGFTTSIENSNPGYKWNWEPTTLVGKVFGGVFGLEEFVNANGETIAFTKCKFARGVDGIEYAQVPKVRLADGSTMDYDDYEEIKEMKKNAAESKNGTANTVNNTVLDDDSLPF